MVLRQVLQLNQPSSPAASSIRAVELIKPVAAAIETYTVLHGFIFSDRAFCQLQAELQYLSQILRRCLNQCLHILFPEAFCFQSVLGEIILHLHDGVRIRQASDLLQAGGQAAFGYLVNPERLRYHFLIYHDSSVVDLLIQMVFFPERIRNRILAEPFLNLQFHLNVAGVVFLEQFPFFWSMKRKVPRASAIRLRRLAGTAEVFDQFFAFLQLLLFETKHSTNTIQPQRQTVVCCPNQSALPSGRIQVFLNRVTFSTVGFEVLRVITLQPFGKTDPFEGSVVSKFRHIVVRQRGQNLFRDGVVISKIIYLDWTMVHGYSEQKNIKIRIFGIAV